MKSINTPSRHRKKILLIAAVVIVLCSAFLLWTFTQRTWPFSSQDVLPTEEATNVVDYSAPSKEQTNAGNSIKEQSASNATANTTNDSPSTIPVTISSVQPGSTVYIRALIGTVTSTATCSLEMTGPNGKSYTATTPTQAMASTSTCQGFNVPMSSLASGSWEITITVSDGSASGKDSTKRDL